MTSATVASNVIVLEALNKHNYKDWSSRVETYLLSKDLWDIVKAEPPKAENGEAYKAWRKKNAKALHAIKISCGTEIFYLIRETSIAKTAWEILEKASKFNATLLYEEQERDGSLHTANNAGQTREVGKESLLADEESEIDASEGGDEKNVNYEYDPSYNPFFKYVIRGDWDHAKECLASIRPDAVRARCPNDGCTALELAVWEGHVHIVKELTSLMTQEDLEIEDNDGDTALHSAVYLGHVNIVKELVSSMRQQGLRIKNNSGATPLHIAAQKGHLHILKELMSLMREEDLEIKDKDGYTALHIEVINENVDIVKQLVALMRREGLGIKSNNGQTALHFATMLGNVDIVKELVSLMTQEDLEIRDNDGYTALYRAFIQGNVDIVKQLVALMRPEGLGIKSNKGETALHFATVFGHVDIVKKLVSLMRAKDLKIRDYVGYTALSNTLYLDQSEQDIVQIVEEMVEKNKKILGISSSRKNFIPIVEAFSLRKWRIFRYLSRLTPLGAPQNRTQGAQLISMCIRLGKGVDVALDLLRRYPTLAVVDNGFVRPPMFELADVRYAFSSEKQPTFLQKWIYDSIHIQPVVDFNMQDTCIDVSKLEDDQDNQRDLIRSVMRPCRRIVKGHLAKLLGINHMYEMKLTHDQVYEFLHCMGRVTRNLSTLTLAEMNVVTSSIFKAVEQGHVEFVVHLCKANPYLLDISDEKDRDIFRYAIECRQEGIYNLFYGLERKRRNKIGLSVDKYFNNSILHCAASLSPLTHIQGASLKMQRELQWFKEVESIIPVEMHRYLNFPDGLTAHELFTKNHKKLMKEAEISMKGTASSCTTIGALIITIMFAVAFTVPGGTNSNTGLPTFIHKKLFRAFIISDTISLVSSSTSVITFLGILTSRYAEVDFLKSLPKKMVVGISTLFISIATMMIAFFCALTIMFDEKAWIIIPSIMFASIPVISFVRLLFPLLVEICISTYGPGIFDRNVKCWY